MNRRLTTAELRSLRHPNEDSRFVLALAVSIPLALAVFFLAFLSFGFLLFFLLAAIGLLWLAHAIGRAHLLANSVRVSEKNFPDIHRMVEEVKWTLDYKKRVDVFIIEEGTVNAFLAKFFRIHYIILNSGLVEDMLEGSNRQQLKWIIARFVGAVRVKQLRLDLFRFILDGIEGLKLFNLFLLPYERAAQYSGDNIGLVVCNNLEEAASAFDKFLVGNQLSRHVNLAGMLEQGRETRNSFLALLSRLFATHPHVIDRYFNLLAFARKYFPTQYRAYVSRLDPYTAKGLASHLPRYYDDYEYIEVENPNRSVHPVRLRKGGNSSVRQRIKITRR